MTKIKQYELDSTIHEDDKVIGTDGTPGADLGRTKNFTIAALTAYLNTALEVDDMVGGSGTLNTIPMWTPDGTTLGDSIMVKDASIPAPDNGIVVKGKFRIDSTGTATDIGAIAAFSNRIVFDKDLELNNGLMDYSDSLGTSGQVLTSTGTAVSWVDVSSLSGNVDGSGTLNTIPIWTPDGNTLGDSVLTYDSPNTAITLTGKLVVTSTTNIQGNLTTEAGLTVNTTLADGSGSYGTAGQILSSTGTATQWINNTVIPANNIVGSGTLDTVAMFTPDGQTVGNSDIIRTGLNTYQINNSLTVPTSLTTTNFYVSNIFAGDSSYVGLNGTVQIGNAGTDILTVTSGSTFLNDVTLGSDDSDAITVEGTLTLQGPVEDSASILGTNGKILISNANGELEFGDQIDTTYTISSAQDGSDVVLTLTDGTTPQDIQIVAGNSISLTDNGNNEFTIAATGGAANTTYDLASSQNGNNVDVSLTGSDATTDSVSLIAGANVTLTDDGSNNITIDASSAVTYDLVGTYNANDTILTLQGSDATSDTFTLHSGSGISFGQDAVNGITTVDFDLSNSGAVGGSGTLNTIPLWTPSGAELGDSSVTLNAQGGVIIDTNSYGDPGSTNELTVQGLASTVVIESLSAGDAHLEFKPNVTSYHQGVFKLTASGTQYGRGFTWTDSTSGELMRLNTYNGNLGLGVTNPTSKLHVDGGIKAENNGQTYFQLFYANNTGYINTGTSGGTINLGAPAGNITNLYVQGFVYPQNGIKDVNNSIGTIGQVLTCAGTAVEWIDASELTNNVSGSGTAGKLPYWNPDGSTLADSLISQTSDNSITIGVGATATGSEAISLSRSEARADYSFAHGYESITDGEFSVTLGKGGYTAGDHSAAIGYKGISLGQSAISGGHSSSAGGDGAVALGHNASAGNYGVAKATSTFPNDQTTFDIYGIVGTVAVGTFLRYGPGFDVADPRIEVTQFTDLGNGAATITIASGIRPIAGELLVFEEQTPQRNDHQGGVALGNDAFSLGQGAVALGQDAVADADFAVAIGKTASTSTSDSIALGGGSTKILIEALVSASSYADDTAAAAGGVAIGELYRNGNVVQIRLT